MSGGADIDPSAAAAAAASSRFGLSGLCCLVTGGTKGIGAAVVEEFSGLGARVGGSWVGGALLLSEGSWGGGGNRESCVVRIMPRTMRILNHRVVWKH